MDALGTRIDIKTFFSQKADQGDVGFLGELYGEAGRRANGGHDSEAGHGCFLDKLETGAAAEQKDMLA